MYKVMKFDLTSAFVSVEGGDGVTYIPHKWVSARRHMQEQGLHLLVFTSLSAARKWVNQYPTLGLCIWKCHIRGRIKSLPWRREVRHGFVLTSEHSHLPWLDGTAMVKRVKLIEEVSKGEGEGDV